MKLPWTNPLWRLIDIQHILTPVAIERVKVSNPHGHSYQNLRLIYIFGIKVAYFNATPF